MAELTGKTISELSEVTTLANTDEFALTRSATARRITGEAIRNAAQFRGTLIPDNSDLDDYVTPGIFYVPNGTSAATIQNTPYTATNFRLAVYALGVYETDSRLQIITTTGSNNQLYSRSRSNNVWGSWHRYLHDGMLPVSLANGGTGATSAKDAAIALGLAYGAGTYSYTGGVYGYVTSSTQVRLFIVPPRSIRYVNSITINSVTAASIRHVGGGYIGGASATLTNYVSQPASWGGAITFTIDNGNGWGVTTNTPVTGYIEASITFT